MTATLKMSHKAIGVEVRRGTYDIVVDGQRAGCGSAVDSCIWKRDNTFTDLLPRIGRNWGRCE